MTNKTSISSIADDDALVADILDNIVGGIGTVSKSEAAEHAEGALREVFDFHVAGGDSNDAGAQKSGTSATTSTGTLEAAAHAAAGAVTELSVNLGNGVMATTTVGAGAAASAHIGLTGAMASAMAGAQLNQEIDVGKGVTLGQSLTASAGTAANFGVKDKHLALDVGVGAQAKAELSQEYESDWVKQATIIEAGAKAAAGGTFQAGADGLSGGFGYQAGAYAAITEQVAVGNETFTTQVGIKVIDPGSIGEKIHADAQYEEGKLTLTVGGEAAFLIGGVGGELKLDIQLFDNTHTRGSDNAIEGAAETVAADTVNAADAASTTLKSVIEKALDTSKSQLAVAQRDLADAGEALTLQVLNPLAKIRNYQALESVITGDTALPPGWTRSVGANGIASVTAPHADADGKPATFTMDSLTKLIHSEETHLDQPTIDKYVGAYNQARAAVDDKVQEVDNISKEWLATHSAEVKSFLTGSLESEEKNTNAFKTAETAHEKELQKAESTVSDLTAQAAKSKALLSGKLDEANAYEKDGHYYYGKKYGDSKTITISPDDKEVPASVLAGWKKKVGDASADVGAQLDAAKAHVTDLKAAIEIDKRNIHTSQDAVTQIQGRIDDLEKFGGDNPIATAALAAQKREEAVKTVNAEIQNFKNVISGLAQQKDDYDHGRLALTPSRYSDLQLNINKLTTLVNQTEAIVKKVEAGEDADTSNISFPLVNGLIGQVDMAKFRDEFNQFKSAAAEADVSDPDRRLQKLIDSTTSRMDTLKADLASSDANIRNTAQMRLESAQVELTAYSAMKGRYDETVQTWHTILNSDQEKLAQLGEFVTDRGVLSAIRDFFTS